MHTPKVIRKAEKKSSATIRAGVKKRHLIQGKKDKNELKKLAKMTRRRNELNYKIIKETIYGRKRK